MTPPAAPAHRARPSLDEVWARLVREGFGGSRILPGEVDALVRKLCSTIAHDTELVARAHTETPEVFIADRRTGRAVEAALDAIAVFLPPEMLDIRRGHPRHQTFVELLAEVAIIAASEGY